MRDLIPKVCHFGAGDGFTGDTVLYKYFSVESFLYLLKFHRFLFQPINNWPDAYEGLRYEFLRRAKQTPELADKPVDSYLGCCWTLQQDDPVWCKYSNDPYDIVIKQYYG